MDYECVVRDLLSSEVPQVYNTIGTEPQAMRGKHDASHQCQRQQGELFAQRVRPSELVQQSSCSRRETVQILLAIRKIINACLRASSNSRPNYTFMFIPSATTQPVSPNGPRSIRACLESERKADCLAV